VRARVAAVVLVASRCRAGLEDQGLQLSRCCSSPGSRCAWT